MHWRTGEVVLTMAPADIARLQRIIRRACLINWALGCACGASITGLLWWVV